MLCFSRNEDHFRDIYDHRVKSGLGAAFLIAAPLIGFIYLGKWLDDKHHTKFYVFIGLVVALAISSIAIGKRINEFRKRTK